MNSHIEEEIVRRIDPIIPVAQIVAEQAALPYCAYEVNQSSPLRTKAGIYGYEADVSVYVVAASESKSVALKEQIIAAMERRERGFAIMMVSTQPAHEDGQWMQKMDFTIKQL